MDLTISEAAQLLGKSDRQIRYLVKTGKLKAQKRGAQWYIDRSELPLSEGQAAASEQKLLRARTIVEQSLGPPLAVAEQQALERRRQFGVKQQPAFRLTLPAYKNTVVCLGAEHAAADALRRSLFLLTEGWHEFQPGQKIEPFRQARICLCQALTELLLIDDAGPEISEIAETIELKILPSLGGMLKGAEKKAHR